MLLGHALSFNRLSASGGAPSLNLNFIGSTTLDPKITFTRASTATYTDSAGLIASAAINAPRFDYNPVTLQPKGLLIEEQRTNLLTYSEQFDNAAWIKSNTTITANALTAPDNAVTADKLIASAVSGFHSLGFSLASKVASTPYTFSFYAKSGEIGYCVPNFSSALTGTQLSCRVNLTTGAVTGIAAGLTASTTSVGNGWWRVAISATGDATTNPFTSFVNATDSSGSAGPFTGDGTSGIYIWGAQLEAGAFATSYIPTVAAQVTRAADNAVMTGTNFSSWYNQSEGTVFAEYSHATTSTNNPAALSINVNGNSSEIVIYGEAAVGEKFFVRESGVIQATITASAKFSTGVTGKLAGAYKANDFAASANGAAAVVDTSGSIPTVTQMNIGNEYNGSLPLNGHIRSITYWPRRLSNAELQGVTA